MRVFIVAVRDRKAMVYGQPQGVVNVQGAIRNFQDQIADPASGVMHKHPEDFDLYLMAGYDDETGLFDGGPPQQIASGMPQG